MKLDIGNLLDVVDDATGQPVVDWDAVSLRINSHPDELAQAIPIVPLVFDDDASISDSSEVVEIEQETEMELVFHRMCSMDVPVEVLQQAVKAFPQGLKMRDNSDYLALHRVCCGYSLEDELPALTEDCRSHKKNERVLLVLRAYPEAAQMHARGLYPLHLYIMKAKRPTIEVFQELNEAYLDAAQANYGQFSFEWKSGDEINITYRWCALQCVSNRFNCWDNDNDWNMSILAELCDIMEHIILQRRKVSQNTYLHSIMDRDCLPWYYQQDRGSIQQLVQKYGSLSDVRDGEGNLPIHVLLLAKNENPLVSNNVFDEARISALDHLLMRNICTAKEPCGNGSLPLHLAIQSTAFLNVYQQGTGNNLLNVIIDAAPHALRTRNLMTRMYPFMEAACSVKCDLSSVYILLQRRPESALGLARTSCCH